MVENRQEFQRDLEAIEAKVTGLFAMVAGDLPGATYALLSGDDLSADESVAFDLAYALVRGGALPEPVYRLAVDTFGQHGTNELIYLVGLYSLVSTTLNAFNVHHDETRGWHYHVTPGKFPHLIGGYWGVAQVRNRPPRPRRGPPGAMPLDPGRPDRDSMAR